MRIINVKVVILIKDIIQKVMKNQIVILLIVIKILLDIISTTTLIHIILAIQLAKNALVLVT
jgi:hypothetical protein